MSDKKKSLVSILLIAIYISCFFFQDNLLQVKSPASSTPAPKSPSSSTPAPKSRRAHESRRSRLLKRISVEVLPDYPNSEPGM